MFEDLEVCQRDLDSEVVFLVIHQLKVGLLLCLCQVKFTLAFVDAFELKLKFLALREEFDAALLAKLFGREVFKPVEETAMV